MDRLAHRQQPLAAEGRTPKRGARNCVDDVELILQRRRTNSWDWGLNRWTRWPAGELSVDYEQAVSTRVALETDFQIDWPACAACSWLGTPIR